MYSELSNSLSAWMIEVLAAVQTVPVNLARLVLDRSRAYLIGHPCCAEPLPAMRWAPFTGLTQPLKSLTPGGKIWDRSQRKPCGSFASQGAVGSYLAVPPQEAGQVHLRIPDIDVCTQIGILVLDCPP